MSQSLRKHISISRSLAFENSPYRQLKDVHEYQSFLQKLGINQNELRLDGKPGYNRNLYKGIILYIKNLELNLAIQNILKDQKILESGSIITNCQEFQVKSS